MLGYELQPLLETLWRARVGPEEAMLKRCRELAISEVGTVDPVGCGNKKIGGPATYRKVGDTCPPTCPLLDRGCYAQGGHVAMAQRRSNGTLGAAVAAAAVAIVVAVRHGKVARINVSGDLGRDWREAGPLTTWLASIGQFVNIARDAPRTTPVAFGYTHLRRTHDGVDNVRWMANYGVYFRFSGHDGYNGAIVRDHSLVKGRNHVKCPAQLTHGRVDCQQCEACWGHPDRVVAFDPHGYRKNDVTPH